MSLDRIALNKIFCHLVRDFRVISRINDSELTLNYTNKIIVFQRKPEKN